MRLLPALSSPPSSKVAAALELPVLDEWFESLIEFEKKALAKSEEADGRKPARDFRVNGEPMGGEVPSGLAASARIEARISGTASWPIFRR